jgi:hypothetical protein
MTSERFTQLLNQLTAGLPITLVMPRMFLALHHVVDANGAAGDLALEEFVRDILEGDIADADIDDPQDC